MLKKRFKKLKKSKLFWFIVTLLGWKTINEAIHFYKTTLLTLTSSFYWKSGLLQASLIIVPLVICIFYILLRLRKKKVLNTVEISDNRHDYIIDDTDYKRSNSREAEYRKKYILPLLHLYKNKCAKCGAMDNGLDIDHFVFSKSRGGNFSMLHKKGHLVNNAIPLCRHCNRSKSDKSHKSFFSEAERCTLFAKNKEMTILINKKS